MAASRYDLARGAIHHHQKVRDGRLGAVLCDVDGVLRHWDRDTTARMELEREYKLPAGTIAAIAFAPELLTPAVTGQISDEKWRAGIAQQLTTRCGSARRASQVVEL